MPETRTIAYCDYPRSVDASRSARSCRATACARGQHRRPQVRTSPARGGCRLGPLPEHPYPILRHQGLEIADPIIVEVAYEHDVEVRDARRHRGCVQLA